MALTKILNVRENEKKIAEKDYSKSVQAFETVATELYSLLKKKEDAEEAYEKCIQSNVAIDQLMQISNYIESINDEIIEVQQKVNQARNDMEIKQVELTDAHIEVKKFEKLIEFRVKEKRERQNKVEKAFMDEISLNQFMNKNR